MTQIRGLLDKYPIECALLRFSHAGEASIATGLVAPPIFATGLTDRGRSKLLRFEQMSLILPNLLGPKLVSWLVKILR